MPEEKLVRNRIPEIIRESGEPCQLDTHYRKAAPEEMKELLANKLLEEVQEYLSSNDPWELVDVIEVVLHLALAHGYSVEEINEMRHSKLMARGGFDDRYVFFLHDRESKE